VDHHIGRLLGHLQRSGEYDDTLIVVTSDHGGMLDDHYMWGKHSPHEGAIHISLIIRDPSCKKTSGSQVDNFSESIDITPTLLDWVGHQHCVGFNGRSLLPLLRGETPSDWRNHEFTELDFSEPIQPTRFQSSLGSSLE
jgi:arylsulfatase A-like enzyme